MSQNRLKILHITDTLGMGGAETWMMALLRLWSKEGGPHCDFLMTSGNRGIFDAEAESLGARLHYIPYTRRTLAAFTRDFRALLRRERYDVIHDHQAYASGWHFLIAAGLLPPVRITHVHNPFYQVREDYGVSSSRRLAVSVGKYLIAGHATAITGTSNLVLKEYGFYLPAFARVPKWPLYCGFAPERFMGDREAVRRSLRQEFGWAEDAPVILFLGRMDLSPDLGHPQNHKNSGFAVDVAIATIARNPNVRFVFAGKPSAALPTLQARIMAADAAGKVIFAGIRSDPERLMLASDALLFPSRAEGLGMVAVEAQSSGLPVLASRAVPDECVVIPKLVRFLEVGNNVPVWVDRLLELIDLPRDMEQSNACAMASPFAIRNSAHALERLYAGGKP